MSSFQFKRKPKKVNPILHWLWNILGDIWGIFNVKALKSTKRLLVCYSREFCRGHRVHVRTNLMSVEMSERCCYAHHMLHRIWNRIRFCLYRTGMITRKTTIRRQRKNTMVWMIMPAGERSELQGFKGYNPVQHPTNLDYTSNFLLYNSEKRV